MEKNIYKSLRLRSVKFVIMIMLGVGVMITPNIYYVKSCSCLENWKDITLSYCGFAIFILGIIGYIIHMCKRIKKEIC